MKDTLFSSKMYECYSCTRSFRTRRAREQHMDDTDHWNFECGTCTRQFNSKHAKEQHMTAVGHWAYQNWTFRTVASVRSQASTSVWGNGAQESMSENKVAYQAVEAVEPPELDEFDSRQNTLTSCMARMFNEKTHADITISMQNVSLPAHRFIICPQSLYLEQACHQAFSKGERTLNCSHQGEAAAHWRVFEYLYTGDYSAHLCNPDFEDDPELSKHLRVYALADYFCIEDLQFIALKKFQREASEKWNSDLFLACIWEAYQSVPDIPRTIRSALIDIAVVHASEVVQKESFKDLVHEGGDFAVDYVGRLLQVQDL
ncbi:hypothetical protein PSPO01_16561 [Paraphaeosphaeria sporulosa]